ncbi:general transcription factor II-I repeat domain-containing protein 2A-like [Centruroides vittatus]|uniref:general transcription factor II-I repeat domain-containing protein 2A-like n=1 Tax=Centruroides vittatus TaxID=120091 RepID=UPI00350F6D59
MKEKLKSYEDSLRRLHGEFERRFEDFSAIEKDFEIFGMPFNVNCDTVKPDLQLELIELQCNTQLKQLFLNVPKLEFYKSFSKSTFPNLISHAQKVTAMFASSYICEQVFSIMKLRKSCLRNRLTDEQLTSLLRISASQFEPNYEKLLEMQSQFHSSHSPS